MSLHDRWRRLSLRWIAVAVVTLAGSAGVLSAILAPWLERIESAGLFALAAALGAALLARIADRPVAVEIAIASLLVAALLFAGEWLIPGLEFIEGQGKRPVVVIAIAVTVFANLGARLGGRGTSRHDALSSAALGLALVGSACVHLVVLGALDTLELGALFDVVLLGCFLLPTITTALFQSAFHRKLSMRVFFTAPLWPGGAITVFAFFHAPDAAVVPIVVVFGWLLTGIACAVGGALGRQIRAASPPSAVPTARAR